MAGAAFPLYLGARKTHYLDQDRPVELEKMLEGYEIARQWVAEEKMDGQWCCLFIDDEGKVKSIVSRWGKKKDGDAVDGLVGLSVLPLRDAILIGELEAGSQAATQTHQKLGIRRVHLFDVAKAAGESTVDMPWQLRRNLLATVVDQLPEETAKRLLLVRVFLNEFVEAFKRVVEAGGEGLMLKRKDSTYRPDNEDSKSRKFGDWVKAKKLLTEDYVVVREVAAEKGGRGAKLGLFVGGKLKEVMQMQLPPEVLDRCLAEGLFGKMVIEAKGNERFSSGAIRHAHFVRVRDDKVPEACVLAEEDDE